MYPKSLAKINWYSSSEQEPVDITKNRFSSGKLFRPHPSAILVGIEDADLRICEISPNCSSRGKEPVREYTFKVSEWPRCQKVSALNLALSNH